MPKPHLISYTERIELNGHPISEEEFVETLDSLIPVLEAVASDMGQATQFEMLTAMAVAYLVPRIDRLVCGGGLGGRPDTPNPPHFRLAAHNNIYLAPHQYPLRHTPKTSPPQ